MKICVFAFVCGLQKREMTFLFSSTAEAKIRKCLCSVLLFLESFRDSTFPNAGWIHVPTPHMNSPDSPAGFPGRNEPWYTSCSPSKPCKSGNVKGPRCRFSRLDSNTASARSPPARWPGPRCHVSTSEEIKSSSALRQSSVRGRSPHSRNSSTVSICTRSQHSVSAGNCVGFYSEFYSSWCWWTHAAGSSVGLVRLLKKGSVLKS